MNIEDAIEKFKSLKDYKRTYYGYTWFKVEVCADEETKDAIDTILSELERLQNKESKNQNTISYKAGVNDSIYWQTRIKEQIRWLKNDIKNTKEKMQQESTFPNYLNDYRRVRMKAYNTKSNEMIRRLEDILKE